MAAPPGGRPRLTLLRLREIVLSADRFCDLEHVRVNSHAQTPHYHQNKIQTIFTFIQLDLILLKNPISFIFLFDNSTH